MMFHEVQSVVSTCLGVHPAQIAMDSDLRDDLGADAIDMIDLFLMLRSRCGINVTFEDAMKIGTVRQLCEVAVP